METHSVSPAIGHRYGFSGLVPDTMSESRRPGAEGGQAGRTRQGRRPAFPGALGAARAGATPPSRQHSPARVPPGAQPAAALLPRRGACPRRANPPAPGKAALGASSGARGRARGRYPREAPPRGPPLAPGRVQPLGSRVPGPLRLPPPLRRQKVWGRCCARSPGPSLSVSERRFGSRLPAFSFPRCFARSILFRRSVRRGRGVAEVPAAVRGRAACVSRAGWRRGTRGHAPALHPGSEGEAHDGPRRSLPGATLPARIRPFQTEMTVIAIMIVNSNNWPRLAVGATRPFPAPGPVRTRPRGVWAPGRSGS